MKNIIIIIILAILFIGCSKDAVIIEENKCECEVHIIKITYNVIENTTRVRHIYTPSGITDCAFDGLEIGEGKLECK